MSEREHIATRRKVVALRPYLREVDPCCMWDVLLECGHRLQFSGVYLPPTIWCEKCTTDSAKPGAGEGDA